MTGHVGIRMYEDLGDNIDRHPVFNRQRGKRMARAVLDEILAQTRQQAQGFHVGSTPI